MACKNREIKELQDKLQHADSVIQALLQHLIVA
jgi:hypothetical protein